MVLTYLSKMYSIFRGGRQLVADQARLGAILLVLPGSRRHSPQRRGYEVCTRVYGRWSFPYQPERGTSQSRRRARGFERPLIRG